MRLPVLLAALLGTLLLAPAAGAQSTTTADLAAGGTVSTGSAVSPEDPVQLTLRAAEPGSLTITKTPNPAYTDRPGHYQEFFGPRFDVSGAPPRIDYAELLIHRSQLPEAFVPGESPARRFALGCYYLDPRNQAQYTCTEDAREWQSTTTPAGDVIIPIGPPPRAFDWQFGPWQRQNTGYPFWLQLQRTIFYSVGKAPQLVRDLDALIKRRAFDAAWSCSRACTGRWTATLSEQAQRLLGLSSAVVATRELSGAPQAGSGDATADVPVSASFLKALKKKRVTQLKLQFDYDMTGPGGEKYNGEGSFPNGGTLDLAAKRWRPSCSLITRRELAVAKTKGRKCPKPVVGNAAPTRPGD